VHERALLYVRELARGELAKALHDFYRLNWIGDLDQPQILAAAPKK
jgi:hypothetical protein